MNVRGQDQEIHAHLGWVYGKLSQMAECVADPVIERSLAGDQVEAGFEFTVAERQPIAVARAVAADDDVWSHAPSASASPMICRMPNACS